MKKLGWIEVEWLPCSLRALHILILVILIVGKPESADADDFSCSSRDVTCLIAAINAANGLPGKHTITLEPGIYTLQIVDNTTDGPNGLPSVARSIAIESTADDPSTVIERDPGAPLFRIFHISATGELSLSGLVVQRGAGAGPGSAILNLGKITLQNTVVTNNFGESGAINNVGRLQLFRTTVSDNGNGNLHDAGGILNGVGGTALIEYSTIAHNGADGSGGINNRGTMTVRNSSLIFNDTAFGIGFGGGIGNFGDLTITNSTIAKNTAGVGGGLGNAGQLSIINSTIAQNEALEPGGAGGGIFNEGGSVKVQNIFVAGNIARPGVNLPTGDDCRGVITSLGNNLVGDPTDCAVNLQVTDLTGDPGLSSLTGTEEEALPGRTYDPVLAGSPIIDKGNPNACPQADQLGLFRVGTCDIGAIEFRGPILASVDIRPKSDANRINPNSNKTINVAIFSVSGFDATSIDANTVRFGPTGTEAAPIHIATRDVDGNGSRDVILRFQIPDTGIKCGDISASLTGQTFAGLAFVGSSPIKTVQCGKQ